MASHILTRVSVFGLFLAMLGALLASGSSVSAAVITVTATADDLTVNGNCTLREAIQSANTDSAVDACAAGSGDDVIDLPAGTYVMSIAGSGEDANATGDLDITSNLAINGAAAGTTIVDANSLDRAFDVFSNNGPVTATIAGLTVQNGGDQQDGGGISNDQTLTLSGVIVTDNDGDDGGGIDSNGDLTINDSTISNNNTAEGDDGGGIRTSDSLTINRSTISGNFADDSGGGGIANNGGIVEINNSTISGNDTIGVGGGIVNSGSLTLNNATVAGNSADSGGGGIADDDVIKKSASTEFLNTFVMAGVGEGTSLNASNLGQIDEIFLVNTIVAGNTTGGDCDIAALAGSTNSLDSDDTCLLVGPNDQPGVDPQLQALGNNGGPTQTQALVASSPAVDTGDPATCLVEDQRGFGFARPQDGNNDGTSVCDIGAYELLPAATPAPGTPTLAPATEAPAALPPTGASAGDDGSSTPWLVLAGLAALGAIGGFFIVRRRMSAPSS